MPMPMPAVVNSWPQKMTARKATSWTSERARSGAMGIKLASLAFWEGAAGESSSPGSETLKSSIEMVESSAISRKRARCSDDKTRLRRRLRKVEGEELARRGGCEGSSRAPVDSEARAVRSPCSETSW